MIKNVKIVAYQVGLVFKDRALIDVLTQGNYWIYGNKEVIKYEMNVPFTSNIALDSLLENETFANMVEVIDVGDTEIVLKYINGNFNKVLETGRYVYWKNYINYDFKKYDTSVNEVDASINKNLLQNVALNIYTKVYTVLSYQKGLLFVEGNFEKELKPGNYFYWKNATNTEVKVVDTRQQQMEISGQEILTKDKAAIRINFDIQYKIVDAIKALVNNKEAEKQLYNVMQLALRSFVGGYTLDELLSKKQLITESLIEETASKAKDLGLNVMDAGIRDIILPGEMKEIMNQVLVAEKKAQANSIMRREETASTRSLLNTSKLMEENEMLWKLKEMEYVEKIADKIGEISISGGGNVISQLKDLFVK